MLSDRLQGRATVILIRLALAQRVSGSKLTSGARKLSRCAPVILTQLIKRICASQFPASIYAYNTTAASRWRSLSTSRPKFDRLSSDGSYHTTNVCAYTQMGRTEAMSRSQQLRRHRMIFWFQKVVTEICTFEGSLRPGQAVCIQRQISYRRTNYANSPAPDLACHLMLACIRLHLMCGWFELLRESASRRVARARLSTMQQRKRECSMSSIHLAYELLWTVITTLTR